VFNAVRSPGAIVPGLSRKTVGAGARDEPALAQAAAAEAVQPPAGRCGARDSRGPQTVSADRAGTDGIPRLLALGECFCTIRLRSPSNTGVSRPSIVARVGDAPADVHGGRVALHRGFSKTERGSVALCLLCLRVLGARDRGAENGRDDQLGEAQFRRGGHRRKAPKPPLEDRPVLE